MTPLPLIPTVVVLVDDHGNLVAQASDLGPDLQVVVTGNRGDFDKEKVGLPNQKDNS
jgi:hypothetical protein